MGFAKFMSSWTGRIIRIIAGIALLYVGLVSVRGTVGIILAVVGLVPLLAPIFDVCVFAPLFGGPFLGKDARA